MVWQCQVLVYGCAGWRVETIEQLGDRHRGYHRLQTALHGFYGTQCGYCSPGMIMTLYGQMKSKGELTCSDVEKSLDGNLCRCTGYRPILDAFKSLTVDASPQLKNQLADIEEAYKGCIGKGCGGCDKSKDGTTACCSTAPSAPHTDISRVFGSVRWYRPTTLEGAYSILTMIGKDEKVRVVVGNTGQGVFKHDGPYSVYIHTGGVAELYKTQPVSPLVLGANVSLARAIQIFKQMAATEPGYNHLAALAAHWQVVANASVRNVGCWAGNLMMKHSHRSFQSDIFLTLLAAGAQLTVGHAGAAAPSHLNLEQFLNTDMSRSLILSLTLPPLPPNTQLRTFKITPRAVNAHAYINACFRFQLDAADGYRVMSKPTIVLGGVNPDFIHAARTEEYLQDKRLTDEKVVAEAVRMVGEEVVPDNQPHDASPAYRTSLAQGLLFKSIVGFLGESAGTRTQTAGPCLQRPLSSSQQTFDMDKEQWPVGQAVPKLESATQISGEATYLDDIPCLPNELHGALVLTTVAKAKIKSVNAAAALKEDGVVDFVTAEDIVGKNSFVVIAGKFPDPVFVGERVLYAGQPVGLVVARGREVAWRAAQLVQVQYEEVEPPVLTIKQAIAEGRDEVALNFYTGKREIQKFGDPEGGLARGKHRLSGELTQGTQYHLPMEAHAARVVPNEDGYQAYCTTQWPTETQSVVAQVLDVPAHRVDLAVRRLGGGYGAKISRVNVVAAAAAAAAGKLKQPVRVVVDLNTNMSYAGWREPYYSKYEVSFDDAGKLEGLKVDMYSDLGHVANETSVSFLGSVVQNTYYIPNLAFTAHVVTTDTAANTWCRAPGHVEAVATIENIMEQVAVHLGLEPLDVRLINMVPPGQARLLAPPIDRNVANDIILPLLMEKASYAQRKEETELFNKSHRWRKRGLSLLPMWYAFDYPYMFRYGMQVTIYEHDGSVAISHGGVEMGQGINTKVAQVAAHVLGVELEKVVIKASDTMMGANSAVTGGSFGTDLCAHGVRSACAALRQRLDRVRCTMRDEAGQDPTWVELVKKCYDEDVDLSERYWTTRGEFPHRYDIWGGCCLEVELDVLTGVYLIRRADLIEDCGRSMNPYVDVGQVEGAFIMGLGLYTSELVKYHPHTGQKLSNGTWEYKPPTALDIPVDLRVTLLPNANHPHGVLGSKATGEPPLCLSYTVVTALRQAITAFRHESGDHSWFNMDTPITVEKAHLLCGVKPEQLQLQE